MHRLDFDIEGSPLNNKASITRRDQALAALQKADPSVQVDFTLPVDPGGQPSNALNLLKDAEAQGVKVSAVNIMTMDFGDGENALNDAESAAKGTAKQLANPVARRGPSTCRQLSRDRTDENESLFRPTVSNSQPGARKNDGPPSLPSR